MGFFGAVVVGVHRMIRAISPTLSSGTDVDYLGDTCLDGYAAYVFGGANHQTDRSTFYGIGRNWS